MCICTSNELFWDFLSVLRPSYCPESVGGLMAKTKPGKKDLDSYTVKGTNKVVRRNENFLSPLFYLSPWCDKFWILVLKAMCDFFYRFGVPKIWLKNVTWTLGHLLSPQSSKILSNFLLWMSDFLFFIYQQWIFLLLC